jgi:hypothetical protein
MNRRDVWEVVKLLPQFWFALGWGTGIVIFLVALPWLSN